MAQIIYGNEIASDIKAELKQRIEEYRQAGKRLPRLVVVLVGDHPASVSYVRGKEKACIAIGMENELLRLDETTTQEELLDVIQGFNKNDQVDGILVQLPLPKHMDEQAVLHAIAPDKDVDGFHPYNLGNMIIGANTYLPCTPKGIMELLKRVGWKDLSGKTAVVIGRSNIVGKPIAQLLLQANATVIMTHSKTENIKDLTRQADILIVAIGKARYVNADWIKEGAVVIDVGVNRDEHEKLCGDVDFDSVLPKCSYITPVPKGVGPMTIAMLLSNTFDAYEKHIKNDIVK